MWQQRAMGANSIRTGRARHLHHNYKEQYIVLATHHATTIQAYNYYVRKKMAKETRSNIQTYFAYNKEENSSRCLVQDGQKQCSKILTCALPNLSTAKSCLLVFAYVYHNSTIYSVMVLLFSSSYKFSSSNSYIHLVIGIGYTPR